MSDRSVVENETAMSPIEVRGEDQAHSRGSLRRVPVGTVLAVVAGLAAVYFVPYVVSGSMLALMLSAVIAAIAILGLNLLFGYCGQISIGHAAFLGIGAYVSAVLVIESGWSYPVAVPVSMLVAFAVGATVSIPALRLKGLYLALLTLAVGVTFPSVVRRLEGITQGDRGMFGVQWRAPSWTGLVGFEGQIIWMFWTAGACLVLSCLVVHNIVSSRIGRSLVAIRDHEVAAASAGVPIARTKAMAFGTAGAFGALAGGLTAASVGVITPSQFGLLQSIELLVAVVVGGAASIRGSLYGGAFYVFIPYYASEVASGELAQAVFAVSILIALFVAPRGVDGLAVDLLRRVRGRRRSRPGLPDIPSSGHH
ncbi:branched-chain amino acid ABC transporter permease [Nocardioides humi]|uniref:Branched-chain amino acid ABC transporter permease n=1 Tax=Nocardioides humi TaxID=449461 RepID=A0ABN2A6C5_9ACTN|nr:branched-chain amino acid ABC transporter permease [Nocardioides humi]